MSDEKEGSRLRALETPVLFLVFNRPELTKQVFAAIREARPTRLYIAGDGPRSRHSTDSERVRRVRDFIAQSVDWDCTVQTLYRDANLGCRRAVSEAITWFFEQEEQGIILEDDCLPSLSFFWFCQSLLNKYFANHRVAQICGFNSIDSYPSLKDYFFSMYGPIWGWATWRRAWTIYDVDMKQWPEVRSLGLYKKFTFSSHEEEFRLRVFEGVYRNEIDTWDYQWVFSKLINNKLSIIPRQNLILNIGFNEQATHTKRTPRFLKGLQSHELVIKEYQQQVEIEYAYDAMYRQRFFGRHSFWQKMVALLGSQVSNLSNRIKST